MFTVTTVFGCCTIHDSPTTGKYCNVPLHLPSHPLPSIATPPPFHCNTSPPPLQHLSFVRCNTCPPVCCNNPPHPLQQLSPFVATALPIRCNSSPPPPLHPLHPSISIATPLLPRCNTASIRCNTSLPIYCNTTPHLLQHLPPATPTHLLHLHPFVPCHSRSTPCLSVDGCMLLYGHVLQVCCFY